MNTFRPRMVSEKRGVAVTGAPLAHASDIGLAEIWRARCAAGARGDYVSRDPRLFVVIEEPASEISLDLGQPAGRASLRGLSATYVPPQTPLRMTIDGATEVRHLDVHFDLERLGPIEGLDQTTATTPRLMFSDGRLERFARLLEQACARSPAPLGLLGDGL
ncbi:hypothetical protein ACIKTA_11755, partial [Hansschlegelia beijingensis]